MLEDDRAITKNAVTRSSADNGVLSFLVILLAIEDPMILWSWT